MIQEAIIFNTQDHALAQFQTYLLPIETLQDHNLIKQIANNKYFGQIFFNHAGYSHVDLPFVLSKLCQSTILGAQATSIAATIFMTPLYPIPVKRCCDIETKPCMEC
jgi:hypothetical protein